MPKHVTTININDNALQNIIRKYIIDCNEKEDIVTLITDTIAENSWTAEYIIKLALGDRLPQVPEIGTKGYVELNHLGFGVDKDLYKKSEYYNNGFIPCTVSDFNGFARFSPLNVTLPCLDPSNPPVTCSIKLEKFYLQDQAEELIAELPF